MERRKLSFIGVPTSAGAYAPGQEKAPDALRAAGLLKMLESHQIDVIDKGNVPGFRWQPDKTNLRAMNVDKVRDIARVLSKKVTECLDEKLRILVMGGDCTIELGSVAGCLKRSDNIGLIYIDLDTDLNTPASVDDGALDWMGVAHLLGIPGSVESLSSLGSRVPMLKPEQVYFFGNRTMTNFEKSVIEEHHMSQTTVEEVMADPSGVARKISETWARKFDHLLIHLDADVLNFVDMPLAENNRRNIGLTFDQLMEALQEFLKSPNFSILTVTEINPDHGAEDGSTLKMFSERLGEAIGVGLVSTASREALQPTE